MSNPDGHDADDSIGPEEETVRGTLSPFSVPADPLIGTEVSGYLVKGRLGSGGMGIVYEGEQTVIGKRVAIKVLKSEVADNPDVVKRLIAEARAVNSVGHRNIIDVFGFGELPDGRQAIIMELLEGESLEQLLSRYRAEHRTMPLEEVLVVLDELLSALAAAHQAGVIHRDLKPSNVFLCQQRDGSRYVKILDFGIAKLGVRGDAAHNASVLVGTPAYMAPEQAMGGVVSPALDLYAVGVMAFEMLTGRLPFIADSLFELITKHQQERPPLPSSLNLGLPDELDDLVMKLLEKRPEHRFASANAVRSEVIKLKKKLAAPTSLRSQPVPPADDGTGDDGTEDTVIRPPSPGTRDAPRPAAPAPDTQPVGDETLRCDAKAASASTVGDETLPHDAKASTFSLAEDEGLEDTLPRGARAPVPDAAATQDDDGEDTVPTARSPPAGLETAEVRRVPRRAETPATKPAPSTGLPEALWAVLAVAVLALAALAVKAFVLP